METLTKTKVTTKTTVAVVVGTITLFALAAYGFGFGFAPKVIQSPTRDAHTFDPTRTGSVTNLNTNTATGGSASGTVSSTNP